MVRAANMSPVPEKKRGSWGVSMRKRRGVKSEVAVEPRYVADLLDPPGLERFKPRAVDMKVAEGVAEKKADELDVLHLGVGEHKGEVGLQVETGEGASEESVERAGRERDLRESGLRTLDSDVLESNEAEAVKQGIEEEKS